MTKITLEDIKEIALEGINPENKLEDIAKDYGVCYPSITEYMKKGIANGFISQEQYAKAKYQRKSEARKGKHQSEETRQKISEKKKGMHLSEEIRQKISGTLKGKYCGESSSNYRRIWSEETRQKISGTLKGKYCGEKNHNYGTHLSEETRQKISEKKKGTHLSEEHRMSISESLKGENHPNFNNWSSLEGYTPEFEFVMRPYISERDNHICQVCGKEENGKKHHTHHIDYNKDNNNEYNLVYLCNKCHSPTSLTNKKNRGIWQELLIEKINEIYDKLTPERFSELLDYKAFLEDKLLDSYSAQSNNSNQLSYQGAAA